MIEEVLKMLRLQESDGRIREGQEELAMFAPQREEARSATASDRIAAEQAAEHHAEREREHRNLEAELQDADRLVEKLDAQVYEVTSKQAMDAIQSELEAGKHKKSHLEDQVLELLEQIETAADVVEAAAAHERDHNSQRALEAQARDAREKELGGELEQLAEERAQRATAVEAGALRQYEDARRKAWPVLALASTKWCPACRIVIAPQKWNDMGVAKKLVNCGSCHRILYRDLEESTSE